MSRDIEREHKIFKRALEEIAGGPRFLNSKNRFRVIALEALGHDVGDRRVVFCETCFAYNADQCECAEFGLKPHQLGDRFEIHRDLDGISVRLVADQPHVDSWDTLDGVRDPVRFTTISEAREHMKTWGIDGEVVAI